VGFRKATNQASIAPDFQFVMVTPPEQDSCVPVG
jgi:hypothetical protein